MIDTSNIVIKAVSKKLEVKEDLVKLIHDYYWEKGVRNSIRSGNHTAIRIAKLGTFFVSKIKLYRRIKKYIAFIRNLEFKPESDFKRLSKQERIDIYKKDLALLLSRRNDLAKLYYQKALKV